MIKLEEIKPKTGSFKLNSTGKVYKLRPFNVEDEIWLRQSYGEELVKLFNENNIDSVALCRIAFRQMIDKSDFKKKEFISINEDGEELKESIGGYRALMKMIEGLNEKIEILMAINETLGISRAKIKELASDITDKKKATLNKKKPTGHMS